MDGIVLPPGGGERLPGINATLKAAMGAHVATSSFELVIAPGADVGAHVHARGEEVFFVLEGRLDVLAFEPVDRSVRNWHSWVSATGQRFLSGGAGAFMHVPPGTPHAFANATDSDVRVFFQSSVPGGHENYFRKLTELLQRGGPPDQDGIAALRREYDIEQITDLRVGENL